jgi:hypothetical protein
MYPDMEKLTQEARHDIGEKYLQMVTRYKQARSSSLYYHSDTENTVNRKRRKQKKFIRPHYVELIIVNP